MQRVYITLHSPVSCYPVWHHLLFSCFLPALLPGDTHTHTHTVDNDVNVCTTTGSCVTHTQFRSIFLFFLILTWRMEERGREGRGGGGGQSYQNIKKGQFSLQAAHPEEDCDTGQLLLRLSSQLHSWTILQSLKRAFITPQAL